jgi:polysaccharide chain length determinant protein (PEP-CTERM system associated)
MLPGKKIAPEDVVQILRRRFWVLVVPFAIVAAGTAAASRRLPDLYQSVAVIQIVAQQVPANYVKPTVTASIQDRLQSIREGILSRTRLEQLIKQFDLYPAERRTGIMQNVVERMKMDVQIITLKTGSSFSVGYTGRDPRTVMKVTSELATMFINESLRDRQVLADNTDEFLDAQLQEAKRQLVDQEKRLEAYRTKYAGQLPTQVTSNLQALANTQMQIQQLVLADNQETDRRIALERTLQDLESAASSPDVGPVSSVVAPAGATDSPALRALMQSLDAAKKQLAALQQHYSDAWPDVQTKKREVEELERRLNAEALQTPVSAAATADLGLSPAERSRRTKIQDTKDQLAQVDKQLTVRKDEVERLRANAVVLQQRIDAVPARESEMTELTRDYGTTTALYTGLLAKKGESKIASDLLTRQGTDQFNLLDPARMPQEPISPNRAQINLFGMVGGLAIGLVLVVLLEYRDSSFATDAEVTTLLALPVLAVVPFMQSAEDRRRARKRQLILNVGLGSTVAGCLAVLAYTFVR